MATRKRTSARSTRSRRSGIVGRAVKAGRRAVRQAEGRVPADLRRQLERRITDSEKTLRGVIKQLTTQVQRAAKQADVDKALKRLDGLSKQVQQVARGVSARGSSTTRRAAGTTRRAASRTRRAAGSARRKATGGSSRTRRTPSRRSTARPAAAGGSSSNATTTRRAPRRRSAARRSGGGTSTSSAVRTVPPAPEPGPMPAEVEMGGSNV